VKKITRELKDHKGKTFLDIMTLNQFTTKVSILANQEDPWAQEGKIERIPDKDERDKYKNYANLQSAADRSKYAPKSTRFSNGKGVKREFGVSIWNEEGKKFCSTINEVWREAFRDKKVQSWISVAWEMWVIDNDFCRHWKNKKGNKRGGGHIDDEDEKDEEDEVGIELLLEGDEGFDDCR